MKEEFKKHGRFDHLFPFIHYENYYNWQLLNIIAFQ
jgi:hypothetical protein